MDIAVSKESSARLSPRPAGPKWDENTLVIILFLTEFMRTIPRELEEAARIDGSGPFGTFWRIILPLSRPGLATLAI